MAQSERNTGGDSMKFDEIVVTDGYDWDRCYSWAWEIRQYWDTTKGGDFWSVHDAFPDINWDDDQRGLMEQCMAIILGLAERPAKRFFQKKVIEDREAV